MENIYNIRYVYLRIVLKMKESGHLPKDKESAIRGCIGNELMEAHCDSDGNCKSCDHRDACVVQKVMYSPFIIKPDFVTTGESIGYVIECDDKKTFFHDGERLQFKIILFGQSLECAGVMLNAIRKAGERGLGKDSVNYYLEYACDGRENVIYENDCFHKDRLAVDCISDYVKKRKEEIGAGEDIRITFMTPTTIKYQKSFIDAFNPEAVLQSMARRIYMLNCFVGNDIEYPYVMVEDLPTLGDENSHLESVRRYSERKNEMMTLRGLCGYMEMSDVNERMLDVILACELTHIGKNTSFGFGKYEVES